MPPAGLQALDKFFKDAGGDRPKKAPNWLTMQPTAHKDHWFEETHGMDPVLNPKPVKRKKGGP